MWTAYFKSASYKELICLHWMVSNFSVAGDQAMLHLSARPLPKIKFVIWYANWRPRMCMRLIYTYAIMCRQPKRAGVYLMGTGGEIPPQSVTYMETACEYTEPFVMHPFAFRTHAHQHGKQHSKPLCLSL
jgi:Copper type II ascorbate-dependent monooxygenase, C-terminal domain